MLTTRTHRLQATTAPTTRAPGSLAAARANSGVRPAVSNQTMQHKLANKIVQTKLSLNEPGDAFEEEADRVADQVMRMPEVRRGDAPRIQRVCAHCQKELETARVQRLCSECEERLNRKQSSNRPPEVTAGVEAQIGTLRGGGQALAASSRAFFEARFGHDFSDVRVHTGGSASETARSLNALAYTSGQHVVFAPGQYSPETETGKRLLAHELTHVVQQGGAEGAIQRAACPQAPTRKGDRAPSPDCTQRSDKVDGARFPFCLDSDEMQDVTAPYLPLTTFVPVLKQLSKVEVHGYASMEGPKGREARYNLNLSCMRANRVANMLAAEGVDRSRIQTFKHGRSSAFGSAEMNRVVTIPLPQAHSFRTAAVSMLACAPCNPFTDDGRDAINPPAAESAIKSFRQKHSIEATVLSMDGRHIERSSARPITAQAQLGKTGYCGKEFPPFQVSRTAPGTAKSVNSPVHGEGLEWESELSSRVGAVVPCTLLDPLGRKPGAPCGYLGTNPVVP